MRRCLEVVLLLGAALAAVGAVPATLMEDTKQAQLHASGKVKRAQEVMLFGNQQNRPSEAAYFQGLKRGEGDEAGDESATTILPADGFQDAEEDGGRLEEEGKSPAQYEKGYRYGVGKEAMDKHVENALLKSELFGEPSSMNQYRYYGGGERRGLQDVGFAPPSKRGGVSSFRPMVPRALPSTPRLKRDLELDPEDVLALLSLWEAEHHKQFPYRQEPSPWSQLNGVEPSEDFETQDEDDQTNSEDDNPNAGGWWDGPVYPSAPSTYPGHFSLEKRVPMYYPAPVPGAPFPLFPAQKREGQWGGFTKDKRFMVSRKRQAPRDGVHSLAQLLNSTPRRDPGVPVLRRMVL
uniref:NVP-containing protein transcript a n=1 Tax=Carausius morosus TaxID=7022 RepID=A0A8K1S5C8_CARMO|nr:NVP-containing protein transcript a [Carausius morosus]